MKQAKRSNTLAVLVCVCAAALPGGAIAQETAAQEVPGGAPTATDELAASKTLRAGGIGAFILEEPSAAPGSDLCPTLDPVMLAWIAAVVILVLTLQSKPLLCWRNADGVLLALAAVLLPLRQDTVGIQGDPTGETVQWWVYLLLSIIALYWLARGVHLLLSKSAPALVPNVTQRAMVVLIVAGLFLAGLFILRAPLSAGSRDGLIGGICTADTGKLPYGDALRHDARSPLLYLLHAGAVKLVPPTYEPTAGFGTMHWDDRAEWLKDSTWETVDLTAVRLVNGLLFVLLFGALAGIGHRQHSVVLGQVLVAILCFFPGALECLVRPEIMLPTVLFAWSIALATLPGVGGLLSVLLLVLAGLAWPWAWLALPVMLAYFFRQRWHALGATVGLLVGAAAIVVGTTAFVQPTLPSYGEALADAGITPTYAARISSDGTVVIERNQASEASQPSETGQWALKSWLWKLLLEREDARLDTLAKQPLMPNGVDAATVLYRDLVPTSAAQEVLQGDYRAALARTSIVTQTWAALRTLLECTWKPTVVPTLPLMGTWELWSLCESGIGTHMLLVRRIAKGVVVVLALLTAVLVIRAQRVRLHQLTGALLAVSAAILLISMTGAATNWVWMMPTVLAAYAARGEESATAPPPTRRFAPIDYGPAPRITVENQPSPRG